jgi:2'-hydroxyisoflavone reductase
VKVLVLGGTIFLGRALVTALREHGHDVTTFTRGVHPDAGTPPATRIHGDREGPLDMLPADGWDAVIDTCGYRPEVVRKSAQHLASAGRYAFISTVSVYDETQPELAEDARLHTLAEGADEMTPEAYGPLKALCEDEVRAVFGARALVVRPGLIVGPYDPSDRFTYWPERAARGGTILAPAPEDAPVQFIDVRDLAAFVVLALERGSGGTFNASGVPGAITMGAVVAAARAAAADVPSTVVWVGEDFLVLHNVEPWTEIPLWIPHSAGIPGFSNATVARAQAAGMTLRPLAETMRDTLAWARTREAGVRKGGLSEEREATLLVAWQQTP